MKILKLKTVCFLAYCHNMLLEAEEQDKEDKGKVIIDDEQDLKETRDLGIQITRYLESINCTKDYLSFNLMQQLKPRAKKYYEEIIKVYYKYFDEKIVPLLFTITALEALQEKGIITIELELLEKIKSHFIKSDYLEKEEFSFMGKTKMRNVEVLKYSDCIEDILSTLDKSKPPKRKR